MSDEAKKTVMVVDDEPEIRKLVGAMVTQFGYSGIDRRQRRPCANDL